MFVYKQKLQSVSLNEFICTKSTEIDIFYRNFVTVRRACKAHSLRSTAARTEVFDKLLTCVSKAVDF